MRNGLIIGAVFAALITTSAVAADLPLKAPPPPPPPAWSWTGFYLGGNIGGAWGQSSWCTDATFTNCAGAAPFDIISQSPTGLVGGGQFGFRWQFDNNIVVGVEGMFDKLYVSTTSPSCLSVGAGCGGHFDAGRTRTTTFNDLTSATGQIGYAWDRALLFVKGGWAGTQLGLDALNTGGADLNAAEVADGWTVGVGLDYMLLPMASIGVQYNYYQFNPGNIVNVKNSGGVLISCAFCNFGNTSVQTVTATLNFKFWGWGPSAVITR